MTLAKLIGLAPEFADVDVVIDKPTLLGRGEPHEGLRAKLDPALNRYLPHHLHNSLVDSIVAYGPGTGRTSRRHALIFPVEQEEQRRFMLTDLGSTNGTFYSFMDGTQRLLPGAAYLLREGDTIHLGDPKGGVRFRINYLIENSLPEETDIGFLETLSAKVGPTVDRTPQPAAKNYALLVDPRVSNSSQGVHFDAASLRARLQSRRGFEFSRGFNENINTLFDEEADYPIVARELERWSKLAAPESLTVFYFVGQCTANGCLDLHGARKFSPYDLYSRLGNIPGRKAVIIDAGRSDKFAEEYSLDSKTFAIVSTRSNPLSLGCVKVKSPNGSINNLNEGWFENDFTRALIEIIDSSPQRLDWTVLGEKLKAKFGASVKLAEKRQEQQIVDGTLYLGTRVF